MNDTQTWDQIVETYPDRWVALSDCNMDGAQILSAVVRAACTDRERLSTEMDLDRNHVVFVWRRTSDIEGAYVL